MKENQEAPKKVTLSELNARVGQIVKEVHYTQQPVVITDSRRDVATIMPIEKNMPKQQEKK